MTVVLDASIALSWFFDDEKTQETDAIMQVLERENGLVPSLFHLELTNILLLAEKKGRASWADIVEWLGQFSTLPIVVDSQTANRATDTVNLARTYGLTTYDAAYLELALRTGSTLATKDKVLRAAAAKCGIGLHP